MGSIYDKNSDILNIFREGKKSSGSIVISENVILDITNDYKVVGLEVHNASKTLKVTKTQLENITFSKVRTLLSKEFFGATFLIKFKNKPELRQRIVAPVEPSSRIAKLAA